MTLGTLIAFLQYMQRFLLAGARHLRALYEPAAGRRLLRAHLRRAGRAGGDYRRRGAHGRWATSRDASSSATSGSPTTRTTGCCATSRLLIEPGEAVAIVGATGAGKSTMMNLLNRFYDVQRGDIIVDGVPVRELRQRELRRQVGMVLQDPFIFTDSVLENVRLRDQSIPAAQVEAAARQVGADGFINRMPQGLREPPGRARRQPLDGAEAAHLAGARGGLQSQESCSSWTRRRRASTRRQKRRCSAACETSWRAALRSSSRTGSTRSARRPHPRAAAG